MANLTSRLSGLAAERADLASRNNLLEKASLFLFVAILSSCHALCAIRGARALACVPLQVIILKDEKIRTLERETKDTAVPAEQAALGSVLRYDITRSPKICTAWAFMLHGMVAVLQCNLPGAQAIHMLMIVLAQCFLQSSHWRAI